MIQKRKKYNKNHACKVSCISFLHIFFINLYYIKAKKSNIIFRFRLANVSQSPTTVRRINTKRTVFRCVPRNCNTSGCIWRILKRFRKGSTSKITSKKPEQKRIITCLSTSSECQDMHTKNIETYWGQLLEKYILFRRNKKSQTSLARLITFE